MRQSPEIKIAIIAQELGVSRDTINEHIVNLKNIGILKRVGGRRTGAWLVMDKKEPRIRRI